MRTVILMAGLAIAAAIRADWLDKDSISFYAIIITICIAMDILEFLHNMNKKS